MKKALLSLAAVLAAGTAFGAPNYTTEATKCAFDFATNSFGITANAVNPSRDVEGEEEDVNITFDTANCPANQSYSYVAQTGTLSLMHGVKLTFGFPSIAQQDQTITSIVVTYASGAGNVKYDAAALTATTEDNVVTYVPVAEKAYETYSLWIEPGKSSVPSVRASISSIVVNFNYQVEIPVVWGAEWQIVFEDGSDADFTTTATTETDHDYTLTLPKMYKEMGFCLKHDGKYYYQEGATVKVNNIGFCALDAYDVLPTADQWMHLSMNTQNAAFTLFDAQWPQLYVKGTELVETPVTNFKKVELDINGEETLEMTTTDGEIYTLSFPELTTAQMLTVKFDNANWSSNTEVELNSEYGAPLMQLEAGQASEMHVSADCHDVVFTFDASWGWDMASFKIAGVAGGSQPVVPTAEWALKIVDGETLDFVAAGKNSDGADLYTLEVAEFSKDTAFIFVHDGKEYSAFADLALNSEYGNMLMWDDPSQVMHLDKNAVNVTFTVIDDKDWGSTTIKVAGTEKADTPITANDWVVRVGDKEYAMSDNGDKTFSYTFDSFAKGQEFIIVKNGAMYTSFGEVSVNGSYSDLIKTTFNDFMTISQDAINVTFTLYYDKQPGNETITLTVKGESGTAEPTVNENMWTVVFNGVAYEMKSLVNQNYVVTLNNIEISEGEGFSLRHNSMYWAPASQLLSPAADEESAAWVDMKGNDNVTMMTVDKKVKNPTIRITASDFYNEYTIKVYGEVTTGVEGVEADGEEALYFTIDGVQVSGDEPGLYIVVKGGKSYKVVK